MGDIHNPDFSLKFLSAKAQSDKIRESKGYICFKSILSFKVPYFVYRRNYISWRKVLVEYYSDDSNSTSNSIKRYYRQKRIITAIHNFLASATFFIKKYDSNQLSDPFHCFIKELRNYVTHTEYFPLTSKEIANTEKEEKFESFQREKFEVYLADRIKKYPNWDGLKLADKFIDDLDKTINLNNLLEEYNQKMIDFNKKYLLEFINKNRRELSKLTTTTEKVHSSLRDIGIMESFPISKSRLRYLKCMLKK